jgi:thioredoxin reductase (NADPH)
VEDLATGQCEQAAAAAVSSMPGVQTAGDVRHGSVKRVASAVGEGSVAVGSRTQYLADLPSRGTAGG